MRIAAQFAVGEYDVVILSADDSSALDTWLRDNKYNIPDGAGLDNQNSRRRSCELNGHRAGGPKIRDATEMIKR